MSKMIYLITTGSYSDYGVSCAFSTKELADKYVAECGKAGYDDCNVEEYPVDERAEKIALPLWKCSIALADGRLLEESQSMSLGLPSQRAADYGNDVWECPWETGTRWASPSRANGASFVSKEHALKLACERRQEWQRSHGILSAVSEGEGKK